MSARNMQHLRCIYRALSSPNFRNTDIIRPAAVFGKTWCGRYSTDPSDNIMSKWGELAKIYRIPEETVTYFRKLREMGMKAFGELTPEELRAQTLRRSEVLGGHVNFIGSQTEHTVSYPGSDQGRVVKVPITVYKPDNAKPVATILIYFHGGGMVAGSRNTHATMLKTISKMAGCIVVSVEYRRAPEHKMPAAFEDCRAVTDWIMGNKTVIGGHADSCVGVAGDSSGGHIATVMAHDTTGLDFQILVYPVTDMSMSTKSFEEFADTPGFNKKGFEWVVSQIVSDEEQKTNPWLIPALRPQQSFRSLPPTLCILAQLDPLRDDGLEYCMKMKEAKVKTNVMIVEGAPHSFFTLPAHFKHLTRNPYSFVATFIQQFQR